MPPAPASASFALAGGAAAVALWALTVYRALQRRAAKREGATVARAEPRLDGAAGRHVAPIGEYFGMDIGGTLTKIVFFSPDSEDVVGLRGEAGGALEAGVAGEPLDAAPRPESPSESYIAARRRASLDAVAAFLSRSRTYGATGVRDDALAFHSAALRGTFHFIRFETRALPAAMTLVAESQWHHEIKEMCATGAP